MGRDHLIPGYFQVLGRRRTDVPSIVFITAALMGYSALIDTVASGKRGQVFALLVFALLS